MIRALIGPTERFSPIRLRMNKNPRAQTVFHP